MQVYPPLLRVNLVQYFTTNQPIVSWFGRSISKELNALGICFPLEYIICSARLSVELSHFKAFPAMKRVPEINITRNWIQSGVNGIYSETKNKYNTRLLFVGKKMDLATRCVESNDQVSIIDTHTPQWIFYVEIIKNSMLHCLTF